MRILVTGGAGFIGSNIVRTLVKDSHQVEILVKKTTNLFRVIDLINEGSVKIRFGDVLSLPSLKKFFNGIDAVIHTVALLDHPVRNMVYKVNYEGTLNVLRAALEKKVKKVIHISSAYVNIKGNGIIDDDDSLNPLRNEYGLSKSKAELAIKKFVRKGLDVIVIRPTTVYGPGDTKGLTKFMFFKLKNLLPIFPGEGKKLFNPVYVSDLVDAINKCLQKGEPGGVYTVSGDQIVSYKDFFKLIGGVIQPLFISWDIVEALLKGLYLIPIGKKLGVPDIETLRLLKLNLIYRNKLAKKVLNWRPKVGLRRGIELTKMWINRQKGALFLPLN